MASLTDITESGMAGGAAVEAALTNGESGKMIVFKRISSHPYKIEVSSHDISDIANQVKYFPVEWITNERNNVTNDALDYFLPLIQGEVDTEYLNGIPVHFRLNL